MTEHVLEQRASAIAEAIRKRRAVVAQALGPQDGRAPFTTRMSDAEAIAWWQKNFYSEFGQRVLQNMKPIEVMELQVALSEHAEQNSSLRLDGDQI